MLAAQEISFFAILGRQDGIDRGNGALVIATCIIAAIRPRDG